MAVWVAVIATRRHKNAVGMPFAKSPRRQRNSLLRAKRSKGRGAELRDYSARERARSAGPPAIDLSRAGGFLFGSTREKERRCLQSSWLPGLR
jgi:hypothetical protein